LFRRADAQTAGFDDGDAARERAEIGGLHEIGDEAVDRERAERERAKEDDAWMRSGRVLAQIGKLPSIQPMTTRKNEAALENKRIGPSL
jgi:hypothetical protein